MTWNKAEAEHALQRAGVLFRKDEPMHKHTSFQVGGPAAFFCLPETVSQLVSVLEIVHRQQIPSSLIGRGSNVIFKDNGYEGFVIMPTENEFSALQKTQDGFWAGAGVSLATLCKYAQQAGLSGLEFAYGIPGSVGGGIYMNAGAYGGELRDVLAEVLVLDEDLKKHILPVSALDMGYRSSCFQHKNWVVLQARFALNPGDPKEISAKMQAVMEKRKCSQPLDFPSAGSAFKRPPGAFAAALIEQCGLKGRRVGDAAVSEKHSGFIVNVHKATCQDILTLADEVAKVVHEQTGYILQKEFQVLDV